MTTYRESIKPEIKLNSRIKTSYRFECMECGHIIMTTKQRSICPLCDSKLKLLSKKIEEVFSYD